MDPYRRATAPNGNLIVIDKIRHADNGHQPTLRTLMSALNLAVMTGGRERTRDEYAALLDRAGWQLTAVTPTRALGGELHILVAVPCEQWSEDARPVDGARRDRALPEPVGDPGAG